MDGTRENTVFVKKYTEQELGPIIEREVWRYAGYGGVTADAELQRVFAELVQGLPQVVNGKVCYRRMELSWKNDLPVLPFSEDSRDLAKCLKDCSEVILFAATLGLAFDRQIERYKRLSPTRALLLQAYGAERIEALCNRFCKEIAELCETEGKKTTPRFSPGYGDLPLTVQPQFCELLDCSRKIGISLNESLLMTPSKSVTAVFGIK